MSLAALHGTRILAGPSLRHVLRSPDTIIGTAATPVAMILLFNYVLGSAISMNSGEP